MLSAEFVSIFWVLCLANGLELPDNSCPITQDTHYFPESRDGSPMVAYKILLAHQFTDHRPSPLFTEIALSAASSITVSVNKMMGSHEIWMIPFAADHDSSCEMKAEIQPSVKGASSYSTTTQRNFTYGVSKTCLDSAYDEIKIWFHEDILIIWSCREGKRRKAAHEEAVLIMAEEEEQFSSKEVKDRIRRPLMQQLKEAMDQFLSDSLAAVINLDFDEPLRNVKKKEVLANFLCPCDGIGENENNGHYDWKKGGILLATLILLGVFVFLIWRSLK